MDVQEVNSITNKVGSKKKRLSLEEYKKRRMDDIVHQSKSNQVSPAPPTPESPDTRARKYCELMSRIAMQVLKTVPKSQKEPEPEWRLLKLTETAVGERPTRRPMQIDMEMKVSVSIGVNTEPTRHKNLDPLSPFDQLKVIESLLHRQKTNSDANLLIPSVIENMPRILASCAPHELAPAPAPPPAKADEHGEDKVIEYLCPNRKRPETSEIAVQTDISLVETFEESRHRKRKRSCSPNSADVTL